MKFHGGEKVQEIIGENGSVAKVVTDKGEYEDRYCYYCLRCRASTLNSDNAF